MSQTPPRRRVHVLAVDAGRSAVLVDAVGALPVIALELADGETTATGVRRAAPVEVGLDEPVVEVVFDDDVVAADDPSLEVPTMVLLDPAPPGWTPPPGLTWHPMAAGPPVAPPVFAARVAERLQEWTGERPVPDERVPWGCFGWYDEAAAWIRRELAACGRRPVGPIEQTRHWAISAVLRVGTDQGPVWFKAVPAVFAHEPAVTALVARERPDDVVAVLAVDTARGWLLLGDVGGVSAADDPADSAEPVARMAAVQRHFAGRVAELVAAGVPDRRLSTLPARLADALAAPEARRWLDVDDRRVDALVTWVTAAAAGVAALGLPDVLVHGDFHPGNVVRTERGPAVFDWSDAAVGHPFVDVVTWTSWLRDDAAATDRVWDGMAAAWADVCPVDAVRHERPTLAGVVAAHHVVSYAAVVAGTERCLQFQHADGLREYVADLELAVRAADDGR